MNNENNMKQKKFNFSKSKLIIAIIIIIFLVVGGTLAALLIRVTNGNYVYKTTCFNIIYDAGEDITGTLFPSRGPQGGLTGAVTLGIDPSCGVDAMGNIYLNVGADSTGSTKMTEIVDAHCADKTTLATLTSYTDSSSCAASSNGIWVTNGSALKYAVYSSDKGTDKPVSVGYVNKVGEPITLYGNFKLTASTTYDIYIWLDGELVDNSYVNLSFSANVSASAEQVLNYVEEPVLDEGMIPVTISDDGTVTTISEDDSNWYDYDSQKWANMVLVTSSSRNTYLNTENVVVNSSDILAYYVWIPRYKYKIWTTGVSSTGNEQSIDIQFEKWKDPYLQGAAVGEYKTHPAFWWDDDNDGSVDNDETLPGIWVGKFETTGSATSPTILPNTTSLVSQTVSAQFTTSLLFAGGTQSGSAVTFGGNNTYGLTSTTDSHMMKNSEWGAVAYLSHSKYGINSEVRINNYYNSGTLTGCGASTADEATATTCGITYGQATSYPQSTTGNITGVYDMSGGANEYVMANLGNVIGSSGFSVLPDSKYYDFYSSTQFTGEASTNITLCTLETCGGSALSETAGWYNDASYFAASTREWFMRSGNYGNGNDTGVFRSSSSTLSGGAASSVSFRTVLISKKTYEVTFDANTGTFATGAVTSKQIAYGDTYGDLPEVSKEGYLFFGWYTEPTGGTKIASDTVMFEEKHHTLYARWGLNSVNINYSVNGGTITSSTGSNTWSTTDDLIYQNGTLLTYTKDGTEGLSLYKYNDPNFIYVSKSGYSVVDGTEWICLEGCTDIGATYDQDETYTIIDFCDSSFSTCDIVLGVNWAISTYTISYDANGGSGAPSSQTKTYGEDLTLSSTVPTRSGYTFLGWSTSSTATSVTYSAGGTYTANSGATLYAVWDAVES